MNQLISNNDDFMAVLEIIELAKQRTSRAVNVALIDLYWGVGEYVSQKLAAEAWGKGTVDALADYIQRSQPGLRGFSSKNIWRMRQFYETYRDTPILSTLLRELPWSAHLHILSRSQYPEEREFYLRTASNQRWTVRELARQMDNQLFARTLTEPARMAKALQETQPQAAEHFKDSYYLEFLGLPQEHGEADLHRALLQHLGRFLSELGRDFCFVGSEYPLQVGQQDFALDLLFFHRGLNCLVAIELKTTRFSPEHLGQLNFYLEALDRDHKKPHENPAIGLLLCASKDDEVVEYALSRSLSPALVAQYQTQLPDKKLLQAKLHEFYLANLGEEGAA